MKLRDLSVLQLALGVSLLAHGALLALRFAAPETYQRVFHEAPLEVILVNAATPEKPVKAQAIAQKSLAGGGDLAQGRATSPLPPSAFSTLGDASEDAQQQIDAMQAQQQLLLAQVRRQLASLPLPDPRQQGEPTAVAQQEAKRRQLLDLLAEIEKRVNEENARPKKRYISPATQEAAYAVYVDALRRRIEARGTERFPEAGGQKLYGELTMLVTVHHDGRIIEAETVESSGNRLLDRRAQAIVRSIGNFGAFTPAMRQQTDQIVLPSRFRFTRDETLEARPSAH